MKIFVGYVLAFLFGWGVGLLILWVIRSFGRFVPLPVMVLFLCGVLAMMGLHLYLTSRRYRS